MGTILVTGGGGFIGSNIVAALSRRGRHRVVVCDVFGTGEKWRNLRHHHVCEVLSPDNLFFWLEMFGEHLEAILHFGGIASSTEQNVDLILEANHTFPLMLWRWCAERQTRFIYASSSAVYGDGAFGFDDTDDLDYMKTLRPLHPLGWSKLLFDRHVAEEKAAGAELPPQWAGLRFFNVYGPNEYHRDQHRSVVNKIFITAQHDQAVKLFRSARPGIADGQQKRDFISVADVVKVLLWLLDNPEISGFFNVGTGNARSFEDLANAMFTALDKKPQIKYIDMPPEVGESYQYFTEADVRRLRHAGFDAPFTSLEEGVSDYVRKHLLQADPYL